MDWPGVATERGQMMSSSFDAAGAGFDAIGLPFGFRFLADSIAWFRRDAHAPINGRHADEIETSPIAAICLLEPGELDAETVSRLPKADAFRRVFPHAYVFDLADDERMSTMSHRYLEMAESVPVFEARVGNLAQAPHLLDQLERIILRGNG